MVSFLFILRVNLAIQKLGINTMHVDTSFRSSMIIVGKESGNSPQEIALWVVSQLPLRIRCDVNPGTVKKWIRKRKVNPKDNEMFRALLELGLSDYATY